MGSFLELNNINAEKISAPRTILLREASAHTNKDIFRIRENGRNVFYYGKTLTELRSMGFKSRGNEAYVISPCDDTDKWSEDYFNCTGIIGYSLDKISNQRISFLTHQNPGKFLSINKREFVQDLSETLEELQLRSVDATMGIISFGGQLSKGYEWEYDRSVQLVSEICLDVVGIVPKIVTGPNLDVWKPVNVFFDNHNFELYIVRPEQPSIELDSSYDPAELPKKLEIWKALL